MPVDIADDQLYIKSAYSIPHSSLGMQVVHSYGEKPNEDFLQYYGFVDIENVHDAYTADLMQWVNQHFHAETGRVQAVEKSKAASKLLKQVASVCAAPISIIFLICCILATYKLVITSW